MTRPSRIGELLRDEISKILREKVSDPRIGFVSVTEVKLSPDLMSARVYVSIYGTEKDKKDSMAGLSSARKFIQGEISRSLNLRYTPNITFVLDKSIERGSWLLVVMGKLEREAAESKRLHNQRKK